MPGKHIATYLVFTETRLFFFCLRLQADMARRFDLNNESDLKEIRNLIVSDADEDPACTEDLGEESDVTSEDEIEQRSESSDTEQNITDEDVHDPYEIPAPYSLGKDKITKWSWKVPLKSKRKGPENIITRLPGVIGDAKKAETPAECWNYFFTEAMIDIIVKYTNQYIEGIRGNFNRDRDVRNTDVTEVKAFLGLLYLAGAFKGNRQSLEELWGKENDGIEKFSLVMSLRRFKTLIRCLRFDDCTSRLQRKQYDRLCPIREIFEIFVSNCMKNYSVGENVTVDEMLPGFRGRCPFRQYIPQNPASMGLNVLLLLMLR